MTSGYIPRVVPGSSPPLYGPYPWDDGDLGIVASQVVAPASGDTVLMTDNAAYGYVFVDAPADLAALSVHMPSEANSRLGQIRRIATRYAIASLTLDQIGGGGVLLNNIDGLSPGDCVSLLKVDANTWIRLIA